MDCQSPGPCRSVVVIECLKENTTSLARPNWYLNNLERVLSQACSEFGLLKELCSGVKQFAVYAPSELNTVGIFQFTDRTLVISFYKATWAPALGLTLKPIAKPGVEGQ